MLAVIAFFALHPPEQGPGVNPRVVMQKLSGGNVSAVARAFGKDPEVALAAMRRDGLRAEADETVGALAQQNGKNPDAILSYLIK